MAVKLNKSISEIITGFGQELAKGLQAYASDIADLRSQLAIKTVDIARFDEYTLGAGGSGTTGAGMAGSVLYSGHALLMKSANSLFTLVL